MDDKIKRMSIKEFVAAGLLFEVNRRVLHPFGLALEVVVEEDGSMAFGGVWDYRDDPEGIQLSEETFATGLAKWEKFMAEFGAAKLDQREKLLGYVVQEKP